MRILATAATLSRHEVICCLVLPNNPVVAACICRGGVLMSTNRVAIVGYGAVGRHMHRLFPDALIYDAPLSLGTQAAVNGCKYAFVAVPTNAMPDGSCDTSIVEQTLSWLATDLIVLRSTV